MPVGAARDRMIQGQHEQTKLLGRAAALAKYGMGLMTLIMGGILLLVSQAAIPGLVVGEIAGYYFMAMGIAAGATQLPNTAERLPGQRRWDRPHMFDGRKPEYMEPDARHTTESEAL